MRGYEDLLGEIVTKSEPINRLLKILRDINLPFEYYVGAGCIANTVWNEISCYPFEYGISDVDIVYYDSGNKTLESEKEIKENLLNLLGDFPFKLDVKNQARVHLWYKEKFGFSIEPYHSLNSAIDTWPTTATALGLRQEKDDTLKIYAPYQLEDLFSMVVRPNKRMITREIYENKANKWQEKWPKLLVIPW
ncbi:nucleotidyltransferase family protein [Rossellomorea sp. NPDC077527]|uniref:nucleotidyltransferase family protein n=1 Tax=Rossellomorea sp. NPDC077527 TaxID=3364510 RepID=UPI0037C57E4E